MDSQPKVETPAEREQRLIDEYQPIALAKVKAMIERKLRWYLWRRW